MIIFILGIIFFILQFGEFHLILPAIKQLKKEDISISLSPKRKRILCGEMGLRGVIVVAQLAIAALSEYFVFKEVLISILIIEVFGCGFSAAVTGMSIYLLFLTKRKDINSSNSSEDENNENFAKIEPQKLIWVIMIPHQKYGNCIKK